MRILFLHAASVAITLVLCACDAAPDKQPPPKASGAPVATAAVSASAAAPVKPAAPKDPLAGKWQGTYEAKKGTVSLPPKVKDKALAADDGKAASGPGTVEIGIAADGELLGRLSGALGACTLVGRAEQGMIRAKVDPEDPRAPGAMTGVLLGKLVGDVIQADLQVAGPDATIVRVSVVELKRK